MKTELKQTIIQILETELKRRRLALILFSVSGCPDSVLSASDDLNKVRRALMFFRVKE